MKRKITTNKIFILLSALLFIMCLSSCGLSGHAPVSPAVPFVTVTAEVSSTAAITPTATSAPTVTPVPTATAAVLSPTLSPAKFPFDFGVFIGLDEEDIDRIHGYRTVVIDAQYAEASQISRLKEEGTTVYSYLNVGSLETFRDYYNTFSHLTLGAYENWDEERWIDVSDASWQKKCVSLAMEYLDKGVDGFFIDNCDVYYYYHKSKIFDGLVSIIKEIRATGAHVMINGSETFISECLKKAAGGKLLLTDICDSVNQETVWSSIDFDHGTFGKADSEDTAYYLEYLEASEKAGLDVYLLEYTTDPELSEKIKAQCEKRHWHLYISSSIELNTI